MGEWQQPEARKLLPSVSEAQVESKSHCPHCSQNVEVRPKDEIRTRANGAPKQVFHLHYSEGSYTNPSPLTCFFFILLKDEQRMASPQSQATRQGFQGQKPPLQKRMNSAGCPMDHQEKAQLGSVDVTQSTRQLLILS